MISQKCSVSHVLTGTEESHTAKCLATRDYQGAAGISSGYTVGVGQTDTVA